MRGWIKRVFCKHCNVEFVRNIYGDEINHVSLSKVYRSWWRCVDCNASILKPELYVSEKPNPKES